MIANLKLPVQILILLAAAFTLYYSGMNDFGSSETAFLGVLVLGLVYHLVFNQGSSKFFLTVISLFAVSTLFHVIYFYNQDKPNLLLMAVNLPLLLVYLILLKRILKETRRRFRWTRSRMWFIVGIVLVNLYLLYSIVGLINQFGMSFEHILFGFGTLIVKLVLLSVGLTCCVFDSQNSRKVNLLTWAFACLFLEMLLMLLIICFFLMT